MTTLPEAEHLAAHVADLRHRIEEAAYQYYRENNPVLSDAEYDQLMRELQSIEEAHPELQSPDSPTQRVGGGGATPVQDVPQHRHPALMLSLANARSEAELRAWHRRVQNILPNAAFAYVCELKIDGLAMALSYERGRLTVGATRGDGLIGENWTPNVRTIPLPDFLIELLEQHRIRQLERRLQAAEWEDKGLVFPNFKGGYLWADPMREQFRRLLQEAKLPPLRFHDLRHSAATILLALGVNPKVVAEWLGHGDVSTTLRVYGHVTESMRREATTKLDEQFYRSKGGQN
jgi:hypothetical protein